MRTFIEWFQEAAIQHGDNDYIPIYKRAEYQRNVSAGLRGEDRIRKQMRNRCGWYVEPSNQNDDIYSGIDGYVNFGNTRQPIQIKNNTTGNRISFEVAKDVRANDPSRPPDLNYILSAFNGRDWNSRAELYVVRNMNGTKISIVSVQEGRQMISQAIDGWKQALNRFSNMPAMIEKYRTVFTDGKVQLILKYDNAYDVWKFLAYMEPSKFKTLRTCDISVANI